MIPIAMSVKVWYIIWNFVLFINFVIAECFLFQLSSTFEVLLSGQFREMLY